MASQPQIDANRLNAQKSTGPVTGEGKSKSRCNAFKHGVYTLDAAITGADPEEFALNEKAYFDYCEPVGPWETYHVKTMIAAEREQKLCAWLEAARLNYLMDQVPEDEQNPLGAAVSHDFEGANSLEKLSRRLEAANRRWLRSSKMFAQLQKQRFEAEVFMAQCATAKPAPAQQPQPAPAPATKPPVAAAPQPVPPQNAKPAAKKSGWTGNEPLSWRL